MGLRINTNTNALTALRNLEVTDRRQAKTLEHLSTGLRINRASDDPAGLVISEQLRTEIGSLHQAVENSQNDNNMISTADAALGNVGDLLRQIRDSVTFALNTGAASPEQVAAEQDSVNQAVDAIDRIANTTRFADGSLLNGSRSISLISNASSQIHDLSLRSVTFAPGATSQSFGLNVNVSGKFAQLSLTGFQVSNLASVTLRITGPRGTADVTIAGGASAAFAGSQTTALQSAVNRVAGITGVFASNVSLGGDKTVLDSQDVGSNQLISLQVSRSSGGSGNTTSLDNGASATTLAAGIQRSATGQDYQLALDGQQYKAVGRSFSIVNGFIDAKFSLDVLTGLGALAFKARNTGMFFQLNTQPLPTDGIQVGIDSVSASALGVQRIKDLVSQHDGGPANAQTGGFLTDLTTGNDSDLTTNPGNASTIINSALNQVNGIRGFLGAIGAQTLEPNIASLGVAIENLTTSESSIRDLNFAEETSQFTKNQILFQAGTAVLASANLIPQSVLTLLR